MVADLAAKGNGYRPCHQPLENERGSLSLIELASATVAFGLSVSQSTCAGVSVKRHLAASGDGVCSPGGGRA